MVKTHCFGQKCVFSILEKFCGEKYFLTGLLSKSVLLLEEIIPLVKIDKKSYHTCVKSEHVL